MKPSGLLARLGMSNPVILAPMGGGPGTPEMTAAVSNAGGLGSLAAAYLTPDGILEEVRRTRALTSRPIAINLFAGGYVQDGDAAAKRDPGPMLEIMSEVHAALGLPAPVLPPIQPNPFPEQLEAVLEARPEVFSFTFGIPGRDAMAHLKSRGIAILGTATTVDEGRMLMTAGVDAVIAQGVEAGAHRGTFAVAFDEAMFPVSDLVSGIAEFAPVIASGGIMDGSDLARLMAKGAEAAQIGTAFLTCPESGAPPAYRTALLNAAQDNTVITRAFSGRPARGIANEFIARLVGREDAILPFPVQNTLTRAMRVAAARSGNAGFLSLWAGQGVGRSRVLPAGELVARLLKEAS